MWNKEKYAEKTVNSGVFDRKLFILRKIYAKGFVIQDKHITFVV